MQSNNLLNEEDKFLIILAGALRQGNSPLKGNSLITVKVD